MEISRHNKKQKHRLRLCRFASAMIFQYWMFVIWKAQAPFVPAA
jgi:hypothetical protein